MSRADFVTLNGTNSPDRAQYRDVHATADESMLPKITLNNAHMVKVRINTRGIMLNTVLSAILYAHV